MWKFFKPNTLKIIIFIVLIIISIAILWNIKIFPCKTKVVAPGTEFKEGICTSAALTGEIIPFFMVIGVQTVYSPISYVIYFILVILIPYILACIISTLFKKR